MSDKQTQDECTADYLFHLAALFIPAGVMKAHRFLSVPAGTFMTCAEGPYVRHVYRVLSYPIQYACDVERIGIIELPPRGECPVSLD